ncbi:hypothetical protein F8388_004079 [Cannabis sativa]|uniref:FAD linked oxidase N-terminal domain-containing protein n=1 Tax=Cannabis sativa TaxID=3483 RepID=A0A7J6G9B8_CANSA|nr:hypothetical protein F8388_004079 [Cannabis sativa]KAF4379514.1 hypothetical protein G4B88_028756 [Cannabis sativa]
MSPTSKPQFYAPRKLTYVRSQTAWVEAGATLGEVYFRINEKNENLNFPGGFCPTVGTGGHFSGGGYGSLIRNYGLAANNIIDAHIVNVDGKFLDRKSMGEDMFWAIRDNQGKNKTTVHGYFPSIFHGGADSLVDLMNKSFPELAGPKTAFSIKLDYVKHPIPKIAMVKILEKLYEEDVGVGMYLLIPYGGTMDEISESAIPFRHRAGIMYELWYAAT